MKKYEEQISDRSLWFTATATPVMLSLPFYPVEAGHFYAEEDYLVRRNVHDSFLLLFTLDGLGSVTAGETTVQLPAGHAVLIDCHERHSYHSSGGSWEFLWMHINGSAIGDYYRILYPDGVFAVEALDAEWVCRKMTALMELMQHSTRLHAIDLSCGIHEVLNSLTRSSLKNEEAKQKNRYSEDIEAVVALIHERFQEPLSIDDMIEGLPLSKYHFIRVFRRIIGVTPYHYLMHYRMNAAKIMLRSSDLTVAEVAERCGFLDTGNFIKQFKKYTGQKPLQYRHYFSEP